MSYSKTLSPDAPMQKQETTFSEEWAWCLAATGGVSGSWTVSCSEFSSVLSSSWEFDVFRILRLY